MVPKPFPYPLSIGIDVCQALRVASFLRNQSLRNRWARKIFTRLEWPALWNQFQKTRRAITDDSGNVVGKDWATEPGKNPSQLRDNTAIDDSIWMLPEIPKTWSSIGTAVTHGAATYNTALSHERSPIALLARHLAGRWAAKEAVIKAHSTRRLYMRDISIVNPRLNPGMFPLEIAKNNKVIALIDPPTHTILIDEDVAKIRALRGFGPRSQGLQKGALLTRREHDMTFSSKTRGAEPLKRAETAKGQAKYLQRRAKVKESERQIAEVSISHDGDIAVAVCMALDQSEPEKTTEFIVDDGRTLPTHEAQWGDEGWFSKDSDLEGSSEREAATNSTEFKEAIESFLNQSERKVPFLP